LLVVSFEGFGFGGFCGGVVWFMEIWTMHALWALHTCPSGVFSVVSRVSSLVWLGVWQIFGSPSEIQRLECLEGEKHSANGEKREK